MVCKAKLESQITVLNPDGTVNAPTTNEKGEVVWAWIYPSSTIKYRVKTFAEGEHSNAGKSDEFTFSIVRQDYTYLRQLSDRVYEGANDENQAIFEEEIIAVLNRESETLPEFGKAVAEMVDFDRVLATVTSKVHKTDENGVYEGSYTLPANASYGQYAFIVQYGYDEAGRGGDEGRGWTLWEALLVALITVMVCVLIYYCFAFIAWGAFGVSLGAGSFSYGVGAVVAWAISAGTITTVAILVAEVAFVWWLDEQVGASERFMLMVAGLNRFPTVGANKYGCEFLNDDDDPEAIMHIYACGVAPHFAFDDDGEIETDGGMNWNDPKILLGLVALGCSVIVLKSVKGGSEI